MSTPPRGDAGAVPRELAEAWSRAEITRVEIGRKLGREVRFGEMLEAIQEHKLTLPRVPTDPGTPGRRLLADILARAS
ncbi:MAG: hypothetical protein K2X11_14070 [Acetobacteraceae bacterium]|nr:hypothetical protein [Acetobacteraceae bacterium]